jgi:phytoene synthase
MNEPALEASYAAADAIARKAAKNFYPCFRLLPKPERDATVALYAFLRTIDDIADGELPVEKKRELLDRWKRHLQGDEPAPDEAWVPAFADVVTRFNLPQRLLLDAVDGIAWDLDHCYCRNFAELYDYCYGVASTAGLLSIRIWGATDPAADLPAEWLGIGFQLTNILRDVREDGLQRRCYLPMGDLDRFGATPADFRGEPKREAINVISFEAERARDYFRRGSEVVRFLPGPGRAVVQALIGVYGGLMERIARNPAAVFEGRVSASAPTKLWAVLKALPQRFL